MCGRFSFKELHRGDNFVSATEAGLSVPKLTSTREVATAFDEESLDPRRSL